MHVECDGLTLNTKIDEGWVVDRPSNFKEFSRYNKETHMEANFLYADICNPFMISSLKSLINSFYNKRLKKKIYCFGDLCACHISMNNESYLLISRSKEIINEFRVNNCIRSKEYSKYIVCIDYFSIKRLDFFINIIFNHVISK